MKKLFNIIALLVLGSLGAWGQAFECYKDAGSIPLSAPMDEDFLTSDYAQELKEYMFCYGGLDYLTEVLQNGVDQFQNGVESFKSCCNGWADAIQQVDGDDNWGANYCLCLEWDQAAFSNGTFGHRCVDVDGEGLIVLAASIDRYRYMDASVYESAKQLYQEVLNARDLGKEDAKAQIERYAESGDAAGFGGYCLDLVGRQQRCWNHISNYLNYRRFTNSTMCYEKTKHQYDCFWD